MYDIKKPYKTGAFSPPKIKKYALCEDNKGFSLDIFLPHLLLGNTSGQVPLCRVGQRRLSWTALEYRAL
jgi:hypothetical protein